MTTHQQVLELRAESTPVRVLLRDLFAHRTLLPMLARQHFKGRYRAARLGVLWHVLEPLARGVVLAIIFTLFVPIETDVPYAPFVLAGTATWTFLSTSVTSGTTSIAASSGIASRLYFPRLLLPAMPTAAALPSYGITLAIVLGLTAVYGVAPSVTLLVLPLAVLQSFLLVWGLASLLALLHVYFRDVGPMVGTGMGILFYATPIIYPVELADRFGPLLDANPFAGAVSLVRWSLFAGDEPLLRPVTWSVAWTVVLLAGSVLAFRRHERTCVDRL